MDFPLWTAGAESLNAVKGHTVKLSPKFLDIHVMITTYQTENKNGSKVRYEHRFKILHFFLFLGWVKFTCLV